MSTHRLQLLLDDERYQRVARLAKTRKILVAAVIREAINRGLPAAPRRRTAAIQQIFAAAPMPVPEPAELRAELDHMQQRHA